MTQPSTTGPIAIFGGVSYPITAEQYALNRAGKPMGHIPGYSRSRAPQAVTDPAEVTRKARAFDAMMAGQPPATSVAPAAAAGDEPAWVPGLVQASNAMTLEQSRTMSRNSALRLQGVDPKAAAAPGVAPQAAAPLDGRALARASMEKLIRARGQEPVKR